MNITASSLTISTPELSTLPVAVPTDSGNAFADMVAKISVPISAPDIALAHPLPAAGDDVVVEAIQQPAIAEAVQPEVTVIPETSQRAVVVSFGTSEPLPVEQSDGRETPAATEVDVPVLVPKKQVAVNEMIAARPAILPSTQPVDKSEQPSEQPVTLPKSKMLRDVADHTPEFAPKVTEQPVNFEQTQSEPRADNERVSPEPKAAVVSPVPIVAEAKTVPPITAITVAPMMPERSPPKVQPTSERADIQVVPSTEPRAPIVQITRAEPISAPIFDRAPAFAPQLMQITRDLLAVADDKNVRFNVRPDVLGPVAVSIERTDAGSNLRLGVENHAAVQAVRQAEPILNDPRQSTPFVQVTVDLTASDQQRSRTARNFAPARRNGDPILEIQTEPASPATGRYA